MDIASAIIMPRFHHQLYPNIVFVEEAVPDEIRTKLRGLGHKISEKIEIIAHYPVSTLSRLNALVVEQKEYSNGIIINAVSDKRAKGRPGPDGY